MATDIAHMSMSSSLASGQMEVTNITETATTTEDKNLEITENNTSKKLTDTRLIPSRILIIKQVKPDVDEKEFQKLFETYGPIKEYEILKIKEEDIRFIIYYDLRHATLAFQDLNGKNVSDYTLNISYYSSVHDIDFLKFSQIDEDGRILVNLALFQNLNTFSHLNDFDELNKLFSTYGCVRAIQDLPNMEKQKVIEFYDLRSAETAVKALEEKESKITLKESSNIPMAVTISKLQQKYKLPILIPQRLLQSNIININMSSSNKTTLRRKSLEELSSNSKSNDTWQKTSKLCDHYSNVSKSCPLIYSSETAANTCGGDDDDDDDDEFQKMNSISGFISKRSFSGLGLSSDSSVSSFEKENDIVNLANSKQLNVGCGKLNNSSSENAAFPTSHQYYFDQQQHEHHHNYNQIHNEKNILHDLNEQSTQIKSIFNEKMNMKSNQNSNSIENMPEIEDSLNLISDLEKNENKCSIENEPGIGISIKDDLPKVLGLYDDETNSNSDIPNLDPLILTEEISSASASTTTTTTANYQSRNQHDISKNNNYIDWSQVQQQQQQQNAYPHQDHEQIGLPKYSFLGTHFNDLKNMNFNSTFENNNLIHPQGYFNNIPTDNNCAMLHHLQNQINYGYPMSPPHPHHLSHNINNSPLNSTTSTGTSPSIPSLPIQNNYNYHIFNAHQHNQHLNQLLMNQRYLMPYHQSHELLLSQYLQSLNQAALLQQAVGIEVLKRLADSNGALLHGLGIFDGIDEEGEDEDSLRAKILRSIWEGGERQGFRRKGKFGRRNGGSSGGSNNANSNNNSGNGDKNTVMSNEKKIQQEKMFAMDLERIKSGQDKRTTLMIKNIPNKYTQRMLLARIEEDYKGTFDFFYLPIDFKNKCNVGYGFINMNKPENIIPFVENMHEQRWDKFNSEKVCCVTYARIQGRTALINHFQNSSLMLEDSKHQPLLFGPDGEPEQFPMEPIA